MNTSFDGGHGIYGAVMVEALIELSRLWGKPSKGQPGRAWKRTALVLAVLVAPMALLLASGLGS